MGHREKLIHVSLEIGDCIVLPVQSIKARAVHKSRIEF